MKAKSWIFLLLFNETWKWFYRGFSHKLIDNIPKMSCICFEDFPIFSLSFSEKFFLKKSIKIHDTIIKIPPEFEAPIKRRWFEIKWKKLGKTHSLLENYFHDLSSAIIVRPIELKLFNQYIENVLFRWVSAVVRFYFCTALWVFIAAFQIGKAFFIERLTLKIFMNLSFQKPIGVNTKMKTLFVKMFNSLERYEHFRWNLLFGSFQKGKW